MGTDIHGWLECRRGKDAPWEAAMPLTLLADARDYGSWACLIGVRNFANFRPVAADRGFPPDASDTVRSAYADARRAFPELYGVSWLRWSEWRRVDWDERADWRPVEHSRTGHPGYRPEGMRGPGPFFRITSGPRALARTSAALSSLADAPHRLPPPPCSCTHQSPLTPCIHHPAGRRGDPKERPWRTSPAAGPPIPFPHAGRRSWRTAGGTGGPGHVPPRRPLRQPQCPHDRLVRQLNSLEPS